MSVSVPCTCKTRAHWRVMQYKGNQSAFNGYRWASSDYSEVGCLRCGGRWRTKAKYVANTKHGNEVEKLMSPNPNLPNE